MPRWHTAPAAELPAAVHAEPVVRAAGARYAAAHSTCLWHAADWLQQPAVPTEEEQEEEVNHKL